MLFINAEGKVMINESISQLNNFIDNKNELLMTKKIRRDELNRQIREIDDEVNSLQEYQKLNMEASILLKAASKKARVHAIDVCEKIVTSSLQFVFQNNIKFIIEEKESGKNPQIEFFLTDENGNENFLTNPTDARGGGVVDIVALGLRIAINQLLYGENNFGPLVFDEPAKYVSREYIGNVGIFLKNFSKDFDRQIIMVTHDEYLSNIGDCVYAVDKEDGKSKIINNFSDEFIEFKIDI